MSDFIFSWAHGDENDFIANEDVDDDMSFDEFKNQFKKKVKRKIKKKLKYGYCNFIINGVEVSVTENK